MPVYSRDDTGKFVSIGLRGDSRIADPDSRMETHERIVHPLLPEPLPPPSALAPALLQSPLPVQDDVVVPRLNEQPFHVDHNLSLLVFLDDEPPRPSEMVPLPEVRPVPPSATLDWTTPPAHGDGSTSTAIADPLSPPPIAERRGLAPISQFARDEIPPAPDPPAEAKPGTHAVAGFGRQPSDSDSKPRPPNVTNGSAAGTIVTDPARLEVDVLAVIRAEIRQRLPYFQACAVSARRRTGVEVRRLEATWTIGSDGSIKEMKIEGAADPQLVTCITHAGSRPFSVQPGTALVVPTPILFVR